MFGWPRGIAAAVLCVTVQSCSAVSTTTAGHRVAAATNGLVIGANGQPPTLNPLLASGSGGLEPDFLFSFLTRIESDGRIGPDLALEVPTIHNGGVSRDGLGLIYKLRHGVRWHDGRELTSADVVFSYRALTDARNNVALPGPLDDIAGVTATGRYSLAVRLKRANSQITSVFFSSGWPLPVVPAHGFPNGSGSLNHAAFNALPIGTGPYRLVEWVRGDHVALEANPYYFKGVPRITHVLVRFNDWETAFNEFRSGELDALINVPINYYATVSRLPDQTTYKTRTAGYNFIAFNMKGAVTSDALVRHAVALGIDRQLLAHGATRGAVDASGAARGIFNAFYDARVQPTPYDPAAARATLDRAGWRAGPSGIRSKNGTKLTLRMISNTESVSQTVDLVVQEQLRAIGIDVAIKTFDTATLFDADSGAIARGDFDLLYTAFWALPAYYPAWFFTCGGARVSGNYGSYCDPQMDGWYRDSLRRFDTAGLQRDYSLMQQRLVADLPIVPLWQYTRVDVCRSTFVGCDTRQTWPVSEIERWRPRAPANRAAAGSAPIRSE